MPSRPLPRAAFRPGPSPAAAHLAVPAAGAGRLLEARERILLAAAVADLREQAYRQQLLLEALLQLLDEAGVLERGEVEARVSSLDAAF